MSLDLILRRNKLIELKTGKRNNSNNYAIYHVWEMKWNEMKWNEMKWNEMKWNEMKWNEIYKVPIIMQFNIFGINVHLKLDKIY